MSRPTLPGGAGGTARNLRKSEKNLYKSKKNNNFDLCQYDNKH